MLQFVERERGGKAFRAFSNKVFRAYDSDVAAAAAAAAAAPAGSLAPLVFLISAVSRLIALSLAARPLDSNYKQRS